MDGTPMNPLRSDDDGPSWLMGEIEAVMAVRAAFGACEKSRRTEWFKHQRWGWTMRISRKWGVRR